MTGRDVTGQEIINSPATKRRLGQNRIYGIGPVSKNPRKVVPEKTKAVITGHSGNESGKFLGAPGRTSRILPTQSVGKALLYNHYRLSFLFHHFRCKHVHSCSQRRFFFFLPLLRFKEQHRLHCRKKHSGESTGDTFHASALFGYCNSPGHCMHNDPNHTYPHLISPLGFPIMHRCNIRVALSPPIACRTGLMT